jgi:hypothetical protein
MDIGIAYAQNELKGDPAAVGTFGVAAERSGFDHILEYDHVLGAVHAERTPRLSGPYDEHDPFHDPFEQHWFQDHRGQSPFGLADPERRHTTAQRDLETVSSSLVAASKNRSMLGHLFGDASLTQEDRSLILVANMSL